MAFIPNDTRFANQWHLRNTDPDEFDLNVVDVWDDYDGSGVEVVAIDTGFDYFHLDFDNYRTDLDWDFEDADDNVALPDNGGDNHGTPVLGLIGAAQDGQGTVGVAFGADIIGYKTDWSRDEIAAGIERATDMNHDIVNMSYWNGSNMFSTNEQTLGLVDAIAAGAEDGRDGRGLIMVKSAGNGRGNDNATDRAESTIESVNNMRETIVVSGVRDDGGVHGSSSPGANVLVSGFYGGVQTTDRSGTAGYNSNTSAGGGDFTNFNGTSAAAPQVAGVIALMLDANPNLGWRDVQEILAHSARHVGSDVGAAATGNEQATQSNGSTWFWNDAQNWNGGGMHFSNDYGFGLVDAKAAVRLAETWDTQKTSANEATPARVDGLDRAVVIAEGSATGGSRFFSLNFENGIEVENITLGINFVSVEDLADLEVYLTSPGGTRVQLIADTGDTGNYSGYWRFGSTAFRGESSEGTWRLQIRDDDSAITSPIEINDIDLWTYGAADSNNDRFIFTNEFSDYAGVAGHSTNFAGGAGSDTINVSAVDAASIINLQNGQGVIDGVAVTMSGIEDVYGGDHQDIIFDGAGANEIHGGRGNDILRDTTAGGNDRYYGGDGDDTVQVYSAIGGDAFHGGAGVDTISWTQSGETSATFDLAAGEARDSNGNVEAMTSFANIIGTRRGDTIIESNAANEIDGYNGNDTVIVTTAIGADTFRGGAGRDTINWSAVDETGATFDLAGGLATDANGNTEIMESFENIIGTENDDIIFESNAVNDIDARGGDDLVYVTTGIFSDSFRGGFGNDTIDWSGSSQVNGTYNLAIGRAISGANEEIMEGFENFIGTNQRDIIIEGNGPNVIDAGSGDDTVEVTTVIGVDSFRGGFGNDTIDWSASTQANGTYNLVIGRAISGADQEIMEGFENFIGTNQNDTIIEGNGPNVIDAGSGDDTVEVTTVIGVDSFRGGFGNDTIDWSGSSQANGTYNFVLGRAISGTNEEIMEGFENFIGTNQRDIIIEGNGPNVIDAGSGDDTVMVTTVIGVDSFTGGFGNDTIDWSGSTQVNGTYDLSAGTASAGRQTETMFGFENFIGTNQRDTIIEGAGVNDIDAGGGNDHVIVNTGVGSDSYDGGAGIDLIDWRNVNEAGITFNLGAGTATGAGGQVETMENFENLYGTELFDDIRGSAADNLLRGMGGDDTISGRQGHDRLAGGDGDDKLRGNAGNDFVNGGNGNDNLRGGGGSDTLVDGDGLDHVFGQGGSDTFRFVVDAFVDRLRDFELGTDLIQLSGFAFDDLNITDMASGHVRIRYGTDSILVRDDADVLAAADFTESDFLFA